MYPGRKGSMAPFSLRLLLAELPLYLGQAKVALDRLTDIYLICSKVMPKNSFFFFKYNFTIIDVCVDKTF